MSNTEIVATLKGRTASDPWLVIHADTVQELEDILDATGPDLTAKLHGANQLFQASDSLAQVAPGYAQGRGGPSVDAVVTQASPQQRAQEQAQVQQPANVAPINSAPSQQLPEGVEIWTAPDPKKPQFQAIWSTSPTSPTPTCARRCETRSRMSPGRSGTPRAGRGSRTRSTRRGFATTSSRTHTFSDELGVRCPLTGLSRTRTPCSTRPTHSSATPSWSRWWAVSPFPASTTSSRLARRGSRRRLTGWCASPTATATTRMPPTR